MNNSTTRLKRAAAGLAALAAMATVALGAAPASPVSAAPANTPPTGGLNITPTSGNNTGGTYKLSFESGVTDQFCAGDGVSGGYRWSAFFIEPGVDPALLDFSSGAPVGAGGFVAPLITSAGAPLAPQFPGTGDGFVNANAPTFTFNHPAYTAANSFPGAGVYEVGVACYNTGAGNVTDEYWSTTITVTGTSSAWNYVEGTVAATPVLDDVEAGDGELTASFTPGTSDPTATSFTVTADDGAGGVFTATGSASPITIPGLTNGTVYAVSVTATNTVGTSSASNEVSAAPAKSIVLPGGTTYSSDQGIALEVSTDVGETLTISVNPTYTVTDGVDCRPTCASGVLPDEDGVANGTIVTTVPALSAGTYTITISGPTFGFGAVVIIIETSSKVIQEITVERPDGDLVLTQRCGVWGEIGPETATDAFPDTLLNGANGESIVQPPYDDGGTPPALDPSGAPLDGEFDLYPYPTSPEYPTYCGVTMGDARLVTAGPAAGQYFASVGRLNQVTVVDTRNIDSGWTANVQMVTDFVGRNDGNPGGDVFDAAHLGFTPYKTADSDANIEGYDQVVAPGTGIEPLDPAVGGIPGWGGTEVLAQTPTPVSGVSGGLGIAVLDARLKLLIPVTVDADTYDGTLEITVA